MYPKYRENKVKIIGHSVAGEGVGGGYIGVLGTGTGTLVKGWGFDHYMTGI